MKCKSHKIRYNPNCNECYKNRPETFNGIFWEVEDSS